MLWFFELALCTLVLRLLWVAASAVLGGLETLRGVVSMLFQVTGSGAQLLCVCIAVFYAGAINPALMRSVWKTKSGPGRAVWGAPNLSPTHRSQIYLTLQGAGLSCRSNLSVRRARLSTLQSLEAAASRLFVFLLVIESNNLRFLTNVSKGTLPRVISWDSQGTLSR